MNQEGNDLPREAPNQSTEKFNMDTKSCPTAFSSEEFQEGLYVHPEARRLFRSCGGKMACIRGMPFLGQAITSYGYRLVSGLLITFFLFKGIGHGSEKQSLKPMFVDRFEATTEEYQRYKTVASVGWTIKPFIALISDAFAFFGYKKRWVLTFSALFAAICALGFALLPVTHRSAQTGALLSFLAGWGQANLDVLEEGLYSRRIRAHPTAGPQLVAAVRAAQMLGGFVATSFLGPLADAKLPWVAILIGAGCVLLCVPLLAVNWMGEETNRAEHIADIAIARAAWLEECGSSEPFQKSEEKTLNLSARANNVPENDGKSTLMDGIIDEESDGVVVDEELYIPTYCGGAIEFNKEVIVKEARLSLFCIIMTLIIVVCTIITTLYGGYPMMGMDIFASLFLSCMLFWVFRPVVAKAALFVFISQMFYMNVGSGLETFYTAKPACLPDGPHFSYSFTSWTKSLAYIMSAVGALAFPFIFGKRSYRATFIFTTILKIFSSAFDLILVRRWNVPHVSDKVLYLLGDSVIYKIASDLAWIPICILLSQLCPRGSESMVYAILAGFLHFGETIAAEIPSLLMKFIWPVHSKKPCNFSNLWKLVVVCHMIAPIFIIFFVHLLIPAACVCDVLDETGHTIKEEESADSSLPESSDDRNAHRKS